MKFSLTKKHWVIAGLLAVVAACGAWVYDHYFDTYHFATIDPGKLYRDGNRNINEFEIALRKGRIKTVVMLNDDQELAAKPQFKEEIALCRKHGIELIRIPVTLGVWPDTQAVQQFLNTAMDASRQPVLVHCAQGVRRTAMMAAAYQETALNYDDAKAKSAIMLWGRKPDRFDDVRAFIDAYDPATRIVKPHPAALRRPGDDALDD